MILTDGVTTYTDLKAQETADTVYNSSNQITIGGVVKQQADSKRLRVTIKMRMTKTQLETVEGILTNFSQTLYYTPTRPLGYKSTADKMAVTAEPLAIEERGFNGVITFIGTVVFEEVIG
jgi:hypothetical protein